MVRTGRDKTTGNKMMEIGPDQWVPYDPKGISPGETEFQVPGKVRIKKIGGLEFGDTPEEIRERARIEAEAGAGAIKGLRPMTPGQAERLGDTTQGLNMLDNLESEIASLEASGFAFGPTAKLAKVNPWDVNIQGYDQLIRSTKQIIGKALEGGVLRKEDENKYDQILIKQGDPLPVAFKKMKTLRKMLNNRYDTDLSSYKKGGWDVSGFEEVEVDF